MAIRSKIELVILLAVPDASLGMRERASLPVLAGAAQSKQLIGPHRCRPWIVRGGNAQAWLPRPHLGRGEGRELFALMNRTSARTQVGAGGSVVAGRTETGLHSTRGWHDILRLCLRSALKASGVPAASDSLTGRRETPLGADKPRSGAGLGCVAGTKTRCRRAMWSAVRNRPVLHQWGISPR